MLGELFKAAACFALHLCRYLQEMRDYVNTAKELQKMLLMLHTRSRAATTIQSTWRGWAQRRKWRPVWDAYAEQKQHLAAATVLQQVGSSATGLCCPACPLLGELCTFCKYGCAMCTA